MLTPWFAVSIGIVIATSLTLTAPHPALTFPPTKSGRCADTGCAYPSVSPAAPAPAIKREVRLPGPTRDANVHVSGIKVEYELLPMDQGGFRAVILIEGRHRLGNWELSFTLPGASISNIMWARWRHDGQDGVVVNGSPLPWPGSGDNEARIVVFGSGTPAWPTGCTFDGGTCAFRAISKSAGHRAGLIHVGG